MFDDFDFDSLDTKDVFLLLFSTLFLISCLVIIISLFGIIWCPHELNVMWLKVLLSGGVGAVVFGIITCIVNDCA